jgi:hypothetical protein
LAESSRGLDLTDTELPLAYIYPQLAGATLIPSAFEF